MRAAPAVLRGVQAHLGQHLTQEQAEVLAKVLEGVVQCKQGIGR
ncbi:MAG: hypothetical protein AAB198_07140 [Actinomycetota bacterium]